MAGRTVLSTKRARDRRQRASQRASKKSHEVTPEREDSSNVVTATKLAIATAAEPVLAKLVDSASSGEEGMRTASSSDGSDDDDEELNEELDDEMVIVCRATLPNFCVQFVPATHAADNNALGTSGSSPLALREFTATIPAFRETRDGFVTYTIALSTCCEPRKHFQVERRFSEFVALAVALRGDSNKPASSDACRQSDGETDGEDGQDQGEEERRLADHNDDGDRNNSSTNGAFQWELPPKTWFKLTHTPALEERRRQLEQCLETLLAQDDSAMSRRALVRDFLMLDIFGVQVAEEKQQQQCQ
ncbi:hypothetical protein Gpo141_00007245 [Globisporangium polare]